MSIESQDLVNAYIDWLKQEITISTIDSVIEITTPFLDRHNDRLQIYVMVKGDKLTLTDDGYTIGDLKTSGFDVTTEKRKSIVESILNGFGAKLDDDGIVVESTRVNFGEKKHDLIQAMLAINDLFVMAQPMVESFFMDDVEAYLKEQGVRFTPKIKLTGKSGFDQTFDFVIPASSTKPERVVKTINVPDRQTIIPILFSWIDVKGARSLNSKGYLILNDNDKEVSQEIISAIEQYNMKPVKWSEKEEMLAELEG